MPASPGREIIRAVDLLHLFAPDAPWATAASHLHVFKLYGEWAAYDATDAELRKTSQLTLLQLIPAGQPQAEEVK